MKPITLIIIVGFIFFSLSSCGKKEQVKTDTMETKEKKTELSKEQVDFTGSYVSDGYDKRAEGYDWVGLTIKRVSDNEITLSVRSRADHKKPTCTFDAKAFKVSDTVYSTIAEGKKILITFGKKSVTIAPENKQDEGALSFFCSGGATVAGTYMKIDGALDEKQIDKTIFSKVLKLQEIGFTVTAKPKDGKTEVEIYPFGLKLTDQTVKQEIDGEVVDAEVEDLDSDGSPEVIVYTQSGADKRGNVIVCSTLGKKSMILAYFPPVSENAKIKDGYNGHDKFTLAENNLVQQFPVYKDGKETGKIKQVSYKLIKGENTKVFEVKNVTEFDKK